MLMYSHLNAVASALFVVQNNQILFANTASLKLVGYDSDTLSNIPFTDLILPEYRHLFSIHDTASITTSRVELMLLTASGEIRIVELCAVPLDESDAAPSLVTAIDITA